MRRRGGFCTFSGTDTPEQVIASSKMRKTHGPFDNFCLSATRLLLLHASTPCSCLFSASSNLFFLLHCIFKNEENARTIRPFYSPCPPEASKTLNITKILCFTTQTGPQGPKTRAKSPLSTHRSRGAHWGPINPSTHRPIGPVTPRPLGPSLQGPAVTFQRVTADSWLTVRGRRNARSA